MPPRREPKTTYSPGKRFLGKYKIVCTKCSKLDDAHVCSTATCGCGGPCVGGCSGIIGRGGMATVYRVLDTSVDDELALKLLHALPHVAYSREQFRNEAKVLKRIHRKTRHVVMVITADFTEDDEPFYLMELLRGRTVRQITAKYREHGKEMPLTMAFRIVRAIATALGWSHACGVVHRDVTPANVFITDDREPKLMDFGVSGHIDDTSEENTRCKGTLSSMSPEQFEQRNVSPQMDIYALGVLFFELVALENPFAGAHSKEEWAEAHLNTPAPRLSSRRRGIPRKLDELVASSLAKDPKDRPQGAHEFMRMLAEIERDVPSSDESLDEFDGLTAAEPELALAGTLPQHLAGGAPLGPGAATASFGAPLAPVPVDSGQAISFWTDPRAPEPEPAVRQVVQAVQLPAVPATAAVAALNPWSAAAQSETHTSEPTEPASNVAIVPMQSIIVGPPEPAAPPIAIVTKPRRPRIVVYEPKVYMESPLANPFVLDDESRDEASMAASSSGGGSGESRGQGFKPKRQSVAEEEPSRPASPTPLLARGWSTPQSDGSAWSQHDSSPRHGQGPALESARQGAGSLEAVSRPSQPAPNPKDYLPIPKWRGYLPTRRELAIYGALSGGMIALLMVALALGVLRAPPPRSAAAPPPDESTAAATTTEPPSFSTIPSASTAATVPDLVQADRPKPTASVVPFRTPLPRVVDSVLRDIGPTEASASARPSPPVSSLLKPFPSSPPPPVPSEASTARPPAPATATSAKVGPGF